MIAWHRGKAFLDKWASSGGLSLRLCAGWFLSTRYNLACFHRTGLQAYLCSIFLTNDRCGRVQSVLYKRYEKAEQATESKPVSSVPPWSLRQFLLPGSCF